MSAATWSGDEIRSLIEMASMGLGEEAICLELKRRPADVREIATALSISLERAEYPMVCPRCGHGYVIADADWCPKCQLEDKVHEWHEQELEEVRLLEEIARADAAERKRRERRREEHGTNPRKGIYSQELKAAKREKK